MSPWAKDTPRPVSAGSDTQRLRDSETALKPTCVPALGVQPPRCFPCPRRKKTTHPVLRARCFFLPRWNRWRRHTQVFQALREILEESQLLLPGQRLSLVGKGPTGICSCFSHSGYRTMNQSPVATREQWFGAIPGWFPICPLLTSRVQIRNHQLRVHLISASEPRRRAMGKE